MARNRPETEHPGCGKPWVFPTEDGTLIFYANLLRRIWHKVQDIAKVRRRRPHDLRHKLGQSHARGRCGPSVCLGAARARQSIDHARDLFTLGAGDSAGVDRCLGYGIGKYSANVGEKRRGREGGSTRKPLILLVELARIELATS